MKKKTIAGLTALGAVLGVATVAGVVASKKKKQKQLKGNDNMTLPPKRNIYFAGGGLAALSGAYYLIHDCNIPGDSIHIFEESSKIGGAFNIGGDSENGYICTSPKLLSLKNHANLMDMLKGLQSVNIENVSVYDEITGFMKANPVKENARIVSTDGGIVSSGFELDKASIKDIKALLGFKDYEVSEMSIIEYFSDAPKFLVSNLWTLLSTAYMLTEKSSVVELKHILNCVSGEMNDLFSMRNTVRAQFNLQETVIKSLENYLSKHNVNFATNCGVIDVDFEEDSNRISAIHLNDNGTAKTFYLNKNDLCFITNGSISECATVGDYNCPAPEHEELPASAALWTKMAEKRDGFGNPARFYTDTDTEIISFTITAKSSKLLDYIKQFTCNNETQSAITTFKDSPWGLTVSALPQPYFSSQSDDVTVISCYGVNVTAEGRYIDKEMRHCSGAELLFELVKYLKLEDRWDEITADIINVIPCAMPYAAASSLPYADDDKPLIVKDKNTNFAFIGQFAKLGGGISYSSEYAVRTAREAAYRLTGTKKTSAPPPRAVMASYVKMFKALKK
ncbi:MAG: oleate hydratase [Candidatus Ornithomonoglobus sp.]